MKPTSVNTLLGGLDAATFLAEYWQKKPLLVRNAVPGFTGLLSHDALFELACNPDVESRYVRMPKAGDDPGAWTLKHGPQKPRRLRGRKQPWTVLVQGLNLWLPAADQLLQRFSFIPQARLDDLMVSYAVDGGGVGPHFDHYDVFLLQGSGKRRWQIADQADRTLVEDAPLRILKNFCPTEDWVLEPGDMLYLPPHWAHNGVALGECTTYSIGFRAPTAQELGTGFLAWLQDRIELDGAYADPGLAVQQNSAEISDAMIDRIETLLAGLRWTRDDLRAFVGDHLSEPKPQVFFEPPRPPLGHAAFASIVQRKGFALDARSRLLFSADGFHLNGETLAVPEALHEALRQLAHQRGLPAAALAGRSPALVDLLYDWYCDGFGAPA